MKTFFILFLSLLSLLPVASRAEEKRIVLIAGKASHGSGEHEGRAGCLLFQKCLAGFPGVTVEVCSNGWPENPAVLNGAAALVIYSDGGAGHPALQDDHLPTLAALMKKGTGLVLIHYAVEPTTNGQTEFLDWLGGAFEINRSVNPVWPAEIKLLPQHPIARGVKPFTLKDEWYFNLKFRDGMKGVTTILAAVPPADTMERADGPHEGNPGVRAAVTRGDAQILAWACERADGGRGFGFTGGHFHRNWGDENFRRVMLNGILWTAKVEVPPTGVESVLTAADVAANQDLKGRKARLAAQNALTNPPAATPTK